MESEMNQKFKSVKVNPVEGIKGANIVTSFRPDENKGNGVRCRFSFLQVLEPEVSAVEFEPEAGAFTLLTACEENHPEAQPHWFFPFYTGRGTWGQSIVEESGICDALIEGDHIQVFAILKSWGER